jgi:hypothetical protein
MKEARRLLLIVLIASIILSILACIIIEGGGDRREDNPDGTPAPANLTGEQTTATYGAELFRLQLTAIERDQ